MRSWCRSTDYLLTVFVFLTCKSVEIIVASLPFKHERMLLLQWVRSFSRLKEKWSSLFLKILDVFMTGSGVLNIPILSISLLERLPAWPSHSLNDGCSRAVCLFTTWLGKELSSAKISFPDFSFKLRIDQGRELEHIKARNICSERICSLFSSLLSQSAALTDCCFSDYMNR